MFNHLTRRQFLATTSAGVALTAANVRGAFESGRILTVVENGRSEFSIVRSRAASPSVVYAAEELQKFIRQMTGAELAIRADDEPLPVKAILLGETAYTERVLNAKPDVAALGADGFRLVTAGDHLCVLGGPARGTLYGVYELLERHWGCRWYASFHSVIPRQDTLVVNSLDDTQLPAFAMREPYWWEMRNGDFAARCRANGNGMGLEDRHGGKIRFGGGLFVHTFYRLVPPNEFFDEHPEYFSLIEGRRQIGWSQLCLTNPDVVRIVTQRVLAAIRRDPTAKLFSVSQNDWDGHCLCDNCMAIEKREESPSGTLIHFVNQVAEQVEKEFPDVWIETLAYQYTRKPPKSIRPRHNVVPRLCTIECDFSLPLDKSPYPQNVRFVADIKGWSAITDKLFVWDYTTNFHNYVGPHPNFPALPGNIRFFRDNRVVGLFEQGANEGPHAEFGELRSWLIAKLLWNPDQAVEPLLDDFFAGYYGAAAGPIREYFNELQTQALDPNVTVRIFDALRGKWLTTEFLERAEQLWAQAEQLARNDSDLLYRVRMGGIPVLWARLKLMGGPERVYQLHDGRLVHRQVDPAYLEAGRELLRRVEEGKVRVREYTGYHQQEIQDIRGHVEGHELIEVTAGGTTVATAPACGGAALRWTCEGGANLLSPAGGGVEIVNRHRDLERPDFVEFEVVETGEGRVRLRAAKPRAVWGPQTRERISVERVLRADATGLTVEQTFGLEKETQDITPAVRAALPLAGAVTVTAGEYSGNLTLPDGASHLILELPEQARSEESILVDVAGSRVQIILPAGQRERVYLRLDRARAAAVLVAIYPTEQLRPGEKRALRIDLSHPA